MTYTAFRSAGKPRNEVIGMSGLLNTARYRAFLAEELDVSPRDIQSLIIGGHGDTMVLLNRYTTVSGIPVTELLGEKKLNAIIKRTKRGGGELVNLMGTSAWYAPGSAVAQMVEAIIMDQKRIMPCCVKLEGEYGLKDLFMGVPVQLGKNGIEKIIEVSLNEEEQKALSYAANSIRNLMNLLDGMNVL
jgi:malate dehydrogenase